MDVEVPIVEFDPDRRAFVNPGWSIAEASDVPTSAVACFFPGVIEKACADAQVHSRLVSLGKLFEIVHDGTRLGVFFPGVGAPLAAAVLEHVIAMGVRHVVACGAAGSLVPELTMGHVVVPDAAVRDEGTSYHYLPPAAEVRADPHSVATAVAVLERAGVPFTVGKTWTTDGLYRETPGRVARRRAQGCLTVEMETAALLAVAAWRDVSFGQLLFAGDDLSGDEWDHRDFTRAVDVQHLLFNLAADIACALADSAALSPD